MKIRLLSLCLVLALIFSAFAFTPASAVEEDCVRVTVGEATGKIGKTVNVSIRVESDGTGFHSMLSLLLYDKTRLTPITGSDGMLSFGDVSGFQSREIKGVFEDTAHASAIAILTETESGEAEMLYDSTQIATLRFRINADALPGDAYVRLISYADAKASTYLKGSDGEIIPSVDYAEGAVRVLPNSYARKGEALSYLYNVTVKVEEEVYYYTVDRKTVSLPGPYTKDGRTVLLWKSGGRYYAPGATVTLGGDVTLEALTVAIPHTVRGASVRIAQNPNDTALRFKAQMSRADFDMLVELFGEGNVSHGMLISPQINIDVAGACTFEAFRKYVEQGKNAYIDFPLEGCYKKTEDAYTFAASVKGFTDANLAAAIQFNAASYVAVYYGADEPVYLYSETDFTAARGVEYVVTRALDDYMRDRGTYTVDQAQWMLALKRRCEYLASLKDEEKSK